jgi:hypothetical protein
MPLFARVRRLGEPLSAAPHKSAARQFLKGGKRGWSSQDTFWVARIQAIMRNSTKGSCLLRWLAAAGAVIVIPSSVSVADPIDVISGVIRGRVTDASTSEPIEDICVVVVSAHDVGTPVADVGGPPATGGPPPMGPADLYQLSGTARTDQDGRYVVSGLRPDTYKIGFTDCWDQDPRYFTQLFDGHDAYDFAHATRVVLPPLGVSRADARLRARTGISGRVTDPTGKPLEDVCIRPEYLRREGPQHFVNAPIGRTREDGTYFMPGPDNFGPPGSLFKLKFDHCIALTSPERSPYATQWWPFVASYQDALTIGFRQGDSLHNFNAILTSR